MNSILVNASNIHVGGGVQVVSSFIYEVSVLEEMNFSFLHVVVSSEIARALAILNADVLSLIHI